MGAVLADPMASQHQAAITIHRPQMQAVYARHFADHRLLPAPRLGRALPAELTRPG